MLKNGYRLPLFLCLNCIFLGVSFSRAESTINLTLNRPSVFKYVAKKAAEDFTTNRNRTRETWRLFFPAKKLNSADYQMLNSMGAQRCETYKKPVRVEEVLNKISNIYLPDLSYLNTKPEITGPPPVQEITANIWFLWEKYLNENNGNYQASTMQYFRISLGSDESPDLTAETRKVKAIVREILATSHFDFTETVEVPLVVAQVLVEAISYSGLWFGLCDSVSASVSGGYPQSENVYLDSSSDLVRSLSKKDAERLRSSVLTYRNAMYLLRYAHMPAMERTNPEGSIVIGLGGLHPAVWGKAATDLSVIPIDYFSRELYNIPFYEQAQRIYDHHMTEIDPKSSGDKYTSGSYFFSNPQTSYNGDLAGYLYRLMYTMPSN